MHFFMIRYRPLPPVTAPLGESPGNNTFFAIRYRSPRLAFIIINVSGVGARGRARVLPSIVALAQPHLGLNVAHVLLVANVNLL